MSKYKNMSIDNCIIEQNKIMENIVENVNNLAELMDAKNNIDIELKDNEFILKINLTKNV